VVSALEVIGIVGIIYIISAVIISVVKFRQVKRPFLDKSALFFLFAMLSMVVIALSPIITNFYLIFVVTEFLFSMVLFYNYLKSNLVVMSTAAIFSYMEDIMIILSIYFSFYITGSILQSIMNENKGSKLVLSSFIIMDSSLVLQAFYILRMFVPFMTAGILMFLISVIIFMIPFFMGGKD